MGDLQEAGAGAVLDMAMEAEAALGVAGGGAKAKAVSGRKAETNNAAAGSARGTRTADGGAAKVACGAAGTAATPKPALAAKQAVTGGAKAQAGAKAKAKAGARVGAAGAGAVGLAKGAVRTVSAVKGPASRPNKRQMGLFLDALSETSNIAASARAAGLGSGSFYRERRRSGEFADAWHEALCEGFVRLETELLSEALVQPSARVNDATLKARAQKYRLGLALLAAHRAAVRGAGRREAGAAAGKDAAAGQARQKLGDKLRNVQERAKLGAPDGADAAFDAGSEDSGGAFGL